MRLGRWIITREHPRERALRKWGQLSPELRELIARAARSVAKDAVQDIMDEQGLLYDPGKPFQGSVGYSDEPTGRHYVAGETETMERVGANENPDSQ